MNPNHVPLERNRTLKPFISNAADEKIFLTCPYCKTTFKPDIATGDGCCPFCHRTIENGVVYCKSGAKESV
jgi:protein-arginine kinase activator protein McsA